MIKVVLELYVLSYNKNKLSHDILSEHSEELTPLSTIISGKIDIKKLLSLLFIKYTNVSSDFVEFISLDPYIVDSGELRIPYYCYVPYEILPTECYRLSIKQYANIPLLRKIINTI